MFSSVEVYSALLVKHLSLTNHLTKQTASPQPPVLGICFFFYFSMAGKVLIGNGSNWIATSQNTLEQ